MGNIHVYSSHSAVQGSLVDSLPPIQSTMYWCRCDPAPMCGLCLASFKHASSYLSGFAISDHVVWCPHVSHKHTILTSMYIHLLRGLGLLTGMGRGGGTRGRGTYLNTVMLLL